MASVAHKNKRKALALERMNIALLRTAIKHNIPVIEIPKKMRDRELREVVAFERIADFLEALGGDSLPTLEDNPLVKRAMQREGLIAEKKAIGKPSKAPLVKTQERKPRGRRKAVISSEVKADG